MLIVQLDAARNLYNTIQGTKFQFEHCWNLLKHSPKWLVTTNNQQPKKRKRRRFEASSPSNLEFEHLEDDDALQVPIVNLERPPGVKAEKERLKKQKCKEGTTSHIEDVLNAMMEEKRKMNEMKMACIEKGRLADHEQEMARILLKDKKLETEKMKIELAMKNLEEVNVMEKMRLDKLKEDKEMEKIRLDKLKEDNEMEKIRMKQVKEETEIMMMDVSMLSSAQQEYIH